MPARIEKQAEPIPGYKLLDRLGSGGFGEVWKCEAPGGLLKAIKFVYGDLETVDQEDAARAAQELKALTRVKQVRHPFILSLERFDIVDGQLLIVMELADRSLWERFRECVRAQQLAGQPTSGIPRQELLGYLGEAAEALDLMNKQYDLLHLDVKPQNLFLVHNHVKVADFGLVKDLEGVVATVTGGVTPVYAAPETFDGYVSRFSDQYSLAIVYQELLTGQRPFSGNTTRQLIMAHLKGQPNLELLPPADRAPMARALAKDPAGRFPTCTDFIQALRQVGEVARPASQAFLDLGQTPGLAPETAPARPPAPAPAPATAAPLAAAVPTTPPPAALGMRTLTRAELNQDGVLVPALVVGVGRLGRAVLQHFRQEVTQRVAPLGTLPHVRLTGLDTDPEGGSATGLPTGEDLIVARLDRPSRYLRSRDALPPVDEWLDPKIVYRIPRSLETLGVRALGRLAFVEHYHQIAAQLQNHLEQITTPEALRQSARKTGLPLRATAPKVFLVAGLAGGTGGGMALDVAYLLRKLLTDLHLEPDVTGLLLVPPVLDRAGAELPLANTYAALTELRHFLTPGRVFQARYEAQTALFEDAGPPFARCLILPAPVEGEDGGWTEMLRLAGGGLFRELFTPLGRLADRARVAADGATAVGTYGVRALVSPRPPLLRHGARRLCRVLTERWQAAWDPNAPGHDEAVAFLRQELRQRLRQCQVDPAGLRERLRAACAEELGRRPEELFEEWVVHARLAPLGFPDTVRVREVFKKAEPILGRPQDQNTIQPPQVARALRFTADQLVKEVSPLVAQAVLGVLDLPGYRLGGAEEAIRQAQQAIADWVQEHERQLEAVAAALDQMVTTLNQEVAECEKLRAAGKPGIKPRPAADAGRGLLREEAPADRIYQCLALRYRQLILQRIVGIYISLRGCLSDQVKELRFCRERFQELERSFLEGDGMPGEGTRSAVATALLPRGCPSLVSAVAQLVKAVPEADLAQLDVAVAAAIQPHYPGLAELCIQPGEALRGVQELMAAEAEAYLAQRLPAQDVAQLFLERQADPGALAEAVAKAHREAAPAVAPAGGPTAPEFCLVTVPATPAGEQLAQSLRRLLPEARVVAADNKEEILFYREVVGLAVEDLPQFGPVVRDVYQMALEVEHFTPHSRQDISDWQ